MASKFLQKIAQWNDERYSAIASRLWLLASVLMGFSPEARAEDWPQFRGTNRDNVWNETGLMEQFPKEGLPVRWRVPVGAGHSSPVVADGRVCVADLEVKAIEARERVQCFDEKTGTLRWVYREELALPDRYHSDPPSGPCATPVVDEDRIFTLGTTGQLRCLDFEKGTLVWGKNLAEIYSLIDPPNLTPSPLIEGDLLIVLIGGKPGACVVAFDKQTGDEVWRALDDPPRSFSSPLVITSGGKRQLIVWTPKAVTSLNPETGETWWREELVTREDNAGAAPVFHKDRLLISGLMFQLEADRPAAKVIWPEKKTQALRILSNTCMPLIQGDEVYAADMYGRLLCLDGRTGEKLWEVEGVTGTEKYGSIHLTPNGDSVILYTDEGNLIRAQLGRVGYRELSRTHLIDPTFVVRDRKLEWAPPAFANGHVFVRSGKEMICASLEAKP